MAFQTSEGKLRYSTNRVGTTGQPFWEEETRVFISHITCTQIKCKKKNTKEIWGKKRALKNYFGMKTFPDKVQNPETIKKKKTDIYYLYT